MGLSEPRGCFAMMQEKRYLRKKLITLLDALAYISVLLLSLQLVDIFNANTAPEGYNYSAKPDIASALFFVLAVTEVLRLISDADRTKLNRVRHILGAALYVVGGALLLLRASDDVSSMTATLFYGIVLVLGRLGAIRRDHRTRSIVWNVILILITVILFITFVRVVITPFFLMFFSLAHICKVAFSQIDYKALEKIIRKTYAVEIIFGMLLLIAASSIMLQSAEPGIDTFADALWYCFAIVTTIGFGDITATRPLGRILSVLLGIYGIIVVSLITSVIVNFYNEVKNEPDEPEGEPEALPEEPAGDVPPDNTDKKE